MPNQRGNNNGEKKQEITAVAIDKDKGSQAALKWAVDNLLAKGKKVTLLHVKLKQSSQLGNNVGFSDNDDIGKKIPVDNQAKELFLPFRCFCTRKDIQVSEVVLEGTDVASALCEYAKNNLLENLVVGSSVKNGFVRFKTVDIPGGVIKMAPEFCTVYIISKGKVSSIRAASTPLPKEPPRNTTMGPTSFMQGNGTRGAMAERSLFSAKISMEETDTIKSPFTRGNASNRSYGEVYMPDSDISFVGSGRPSADRLIPPSENDMMMAPRLSNSSDTDSRLSFGSPFSNARSSDTNNSFGVYSSSSMESGNYSWSGSQSMDEVEAEMRRLKQELKQTMDMYSTACKEALNAKQKALELHRWKVEEQQKLEEARLAEEAALAMAIAEKEKEKCRIAIEKVEAAQRVAELEAHKRISAERKALREAEEKKKVMDKLAQNDVRYRKRSY